MFLDAFSVETNNRVPPSQTQFPQFRFIERFCVLSSNERSDRGALQKDLQIIYWPYF